MSVAAFYPTQSPAVRRSGRRSERPGAGGGRVRRRRCAGGIGRRLRGPASRRTLGSSVLLELDGSEDEVRRASRGGDRGAVRGGDLDLQSGRRREERALWRWRAGDGAGGDRGHWGPGQRGRGAHADRLVDVVVGVTEIGARHGLTACSLGARRRRQRPRLLPAGPGDPNQLERAYRCSDELCELALALGGTVSGEHWDRLDQTRPHGSASGDRWAPGCTPPSRRRWTPRTSSIPGRRRAAREQLVAVVDCQPGGRVATGAVVRGRAHAAVSRRSERGRDRQPGRVGDGTGHALHLAPGSASRCSSGCRSCG